MSTQENIEYIKQELTTQEKLIENFIKAERFYKKYKNVIMGVCVAVVIATIAYYAKGYMDKLAVISSNEAYNKLIANPNDTEALQTLKSKNEKLYSLYMYQIAIKNGDKATLESLANGSDNIVSDLSKYELSSLNGSFANYSGNIYKDIALYQEAYLLIKAEKFQDAKVKLDSISMDSPVFNLSELLKHYLITKLEK